MLELELGQIWSTDNPNTKNTLLKYSQRLKRYSESPHYCAVCQDIFCKDFILPHSEKRPSKLYGKRLRWQLLLVWLIWLPCQQSHKYDMNEMSFPLFFAFFVRLFSDSAPLKSNLFFFLKKHLYVRSQDIYLFLKHQLLWCYESVLIFWSLRLLFPVSRWRSSQFGRRRSRTSRTWFTSAGRLRSCHPSATRTSFLSMKVRVSRKSGNSHTQKTCGSKHAHPFVSLERTYTKTQIYQTSPLSRLVQHQWPSSRIVMSWQADVIIRPGLRLRDVIHLLCSVWLLRPVKVWIALPVCIWISFKKREKKKEKKRKEKKRACTCVKKVCVYECRRSGILRECLSHIWEVSSLAFSSSWSQGQTSADT